MKNSFKALGEALLKLAATILLIALIIHLLYQIIIS